MGGGAQWCIPRVPEISRNPLTQELNPDIREMVRGGQVDIFSTLEESSKQWAGDTAVVHGACELRYADLYKAARRMASKLRSAGIGPGDKIGLLCPNTPAYIVASLAVLNAKGIVVTASPGLQSGDVLKLAKEMKLDAFLASDEFRTLVPNEYVGSMAEVSVAEEGERLCICLAKLCTTPSNERDALRELNAATIRFSSGTLSDAKGIILSHATVLQRLNGYDRDVPPFKEDKIYWLQPIATTLAGLYVYLLRGSTVILGHALDTRNFARIMAEQGITQVYAAPLFYRMMLNDKSLTADNLARVKFLVSTGSALPPGMAQAFYEKFGREIVECYGLAECGRVLVNFVEDRRRRGSVGKPALGYDVKLAAGLDLANEPENVGELCVRGPGLFDAYYKPWRLRETVLEDGWFKTGDLARRDEDGFYWIVGRVKEVINVGGVKVFPSEIEALILRHPAVDEVVVYGVPDPRFGEVPQASIKLNTGAMCTKDELLRYVNEHLPTLSVLRRVKFVTEIPKTPTGKLKRRR